MIKNLCTVILVIGISLSNIKGQSLFDNNPDYYQTNEYLESADAKASYVPNGGCFTPKGDLRALIIFASFGAPYDQQYVGGWPSSSSYPDWATSANKPFYSTEADFINSSSDNNNHSVSKFYYDMSNQSNKFRLFVDYYPNRVIIDATGCNNWGDANQKVIQALPSSFSWSNYDKRKNTPNFANDYSGYNPDLKPDFVIICYRFDYSWSNLPVSNMNDWPGCHGCSGFSSLSIPNTLSNGYTVTSTGFTHVTGASSPMWMFLHETGHSLYNAPHYNGNNRVAGNFFYVPVDGYGMMSLNTYTCALGWERWILDWVPNITASGVNTSINSSADLNSNGTYTLRDFITTGDMIRIKIPNGNSDNQYLWIENHQGKSIFDNNFYAPSYCGATTPSSPRGIVAYIESINDNKNSTNNFDQGNAIRWVHGDGNYDFTFDPTVLTPSLAYCNNVTFNFSKGEANPIAGQNTGEYIRNDYPKKNADGSISNPDGIITYGTNDNSAANEMSPVIVFNGNTSADYFMGKNLGISIGKKVGMTTNPTLINVPQYYSSSSKMASYYLNGISFKIITQNQNGDIQVQVKFNDVDINQNVRWAGTSIILPNITENTSPDVNLLSNNTITIDKSGTPNRHTKSTFGDFVNTTVFTCAQNSLFRMQSNSKVDVTNYSTLILESGSTYEVNDDAVLSIKSNSTLQVKNGANLIVKGSGRVEVEAGGYICLETGASINLQDYMSVINLRNGYQIGVNPSVLGLTGNCSITPSAFTTTGNGSINTFSTNNYIQNQTFTINDFISGFNIFSGTSVTTTKPQGPVIIQNGANVVFDADGDILLDKGFEVQLGGSFEAK